MIKLNGVTKKYNIGMPNELTALSNINLEIKEGEMISIMGTSGAGKSTLMHIIGCIDNSTEGSYFFGNTQINKLSEGRLSKFRNERIGILLQDFALLNDETALQNVMTPLFFGKTPLTKMKTTARTALAMVGVGELETQKVGTMSGGQKQRVALARALVNSPSIILADEPTGALDSKTADEIMGLLVDLNKKGVTVIIVTHDNKIAGYCKRIIEIADGIICIDRNLGDDCIVTEEIL